MTGWALLLAAGQGTRFGSLKPLAPLWGKPMIHHTLDALAPVFGQRILVILGHGANRITPLLGNTPWRINPDHQRGMGHSLAFGVRQLPQDCHQVMVVLADQPCIGSGHYSRMLQASEGLHHPVCSRYLNTQGVPALFPRELFGALARLDGDRGAKALLASQPALTTIDCPEAAWDLDTPQRFQQCQKDGPNHPHHRRDPPWRSD